MRKVLVISDLHCGHLVGLTPPGWMLPENDRSNHLSRLAKYQRHYWNFYTGQLAKHKPFDAVVVNGDMIDGKGERQGGTECITSDREEQCNIAKTCIKQALSKKTKLLMTYGTPSHTGKDEDWELNIANHFGCKIGGHEYARFDGVGFDFKHKIGSSQVPHGRHTAVAREKLWSQLWHEHAGFPKADVLIRSHVHYYSGSFGVNWIALTTPALQGLGSKYGTKECSGLVDFGFVIFHCKKGAYQWEPVLLRVRAEKSLALDL